MNPKIKPYIAKMSPYTPPLEGRSKGNKLLLDFNERTTPIPSFIKDVIVDFMNQDRTHRYPEYGDICEKIAKYCDVSPDSVMITNGSDQGIDVIVRSFLGVNDNIILPIPTFAMTPHCAELQGANLITPHYTRDGGYPLDDVLNKIDEKTKIIVVCNPNSPTGTLLELDGIEKLAKTAPNAIIYIDECYYEFCNVTAKDLIKKYPNIIITRTFSKTWGLSALRIGYIIADPKWINEFLKVRGPYDVNTFAVVALSAALDNPEYMQSFVKEVLEISKPLIINYFEKRDIEYWPTRSNFILFKPKDSQGLEAALRKEDILVRPRKGPNIDGTLRLTFGTKEQMERVIKVLDSNL